MLKNQNDTSTYPGASRQRSITSRILRAIGITIGSLILLAVIVIAGISIWLTPQRLTSIVKREADKYLMADIDVSTIDYTFWSSFPMFRFRTDSLRIISRSLAGMPSNLRGKLPENPDLLFSSGRIEGSINVVKAIAGNIELHTVSVSTPRINIVTVSDSCNNYSILPIGFRKPHISKISTGTIRIVPPARVDIFDLPSESSGNATVKHALFKPVASDKNTYNLELTADIDGNIGDISLPRPVPLWLSGDIAIDFKPVSISTDNLKLDIAGVKTLISTNIVAENATTIKQLTAEISTPDVLQTLDYIPENFIAKSGVTPAILSDIKSFPLNLGMSLREPYSLESRQLPDAEINATVSGALLSLPIPGYKPVSIKDLSADVTLLSTGGNEAGSLLSINNCSFTASGGMRVTISGKIDSLVGKNPVINADLTCHTDLDKIEQRFLPSSTFRIGGKLKATSHINARLADINSASLEKMNLRGELQVPVLTIKDAATKLKASLSGLTMTYGIKAGKGADASEAQLLVKAKGIESESADIGGSISGLDLEIKGVLRSSPFMATSFNTDASSEEDSILSADIRHTPLFLVPQLPPMLQTGLSMANFSADMKADNGSFKAKAYPAPHTFSGMHISTDTDTLTIHNLDVTSGKTSAGIKGYVANLRSFLLSSSPAPLSIDIDAGFSDVDINGLCVTYYDGQSAISGKPADYKVAPLGPPTASDSVCVVIPRNLDARINLHSEKAEYMQYQFEPLSTEITVKNGVAKIGRLNIGSSFANACLDWTYSTSDLNDIFMQLDLDVDNFDVRNFFKEFPQLSAGTPQLESINGVLNANVDGKFLMFPDMYLNAPSMEAKVSLKGDSVVITRDDEKLKHITHLMLIKGEDPIAIDGLDITGSFHDNLLQLDPFTIDFGGYKVLMAGVNNLQGNIYYHAGLLGSPFHLPFGVNIVGNYHHPEIRFGGRWVKDGRERDIAADLKDDVHVNIMRELHHGWLEFVALAAKYAAKNNQDRISSVY